VLVLHKIFDDAFRNTFRNKGWFGWACRSRAFWAVLSIGYAPRNDLSRNKKEPLVFTQSYPDGIGAASSGKNSALY
jgi:hypothetical protein